MIVGAYALAFHGVPRATGDIDILVRPSSDNAAGVAELNFYAERVVYQIGIAPRRVDILTSISGLSFDQAWSSRRRAELHGDSVHFIGKEALIVNKRATGRTKDLADMERLES